MKKQTKRREATLRPFEILLVEDNPADVRLTQESLKEGKVLHHLSITPDGEEALQFLYRRGKYAKAPSPDLILLDLELPKKDGREVLREIKRDSKLKHIPVVILTVSKAEEDIVKTYKLHANAYINKPVNMEGLIDVVKSIKDFWFSVVKLPPHKAK